MRDRLTRDIFVSHDPNDATGVLEAALVKVIAAEDTGRKIERANREGKIRRYLGNDFIGEAVQKGIITKEEGQALRERRELVAKVIAVDHFDPDEITGRSAIGHNSRPSNAFDSRPCQQWRHSSGRIAEDEMMRSRCPNLKHWHFEIDFENIAWATFDQQGAWTNTFGTETTRELDEDHRRDRGGGAAERGEGADLRLRQGEGFVAGADIREFENLTRETDVEDFVRQVRRSSTASSRCRSR